MKVSFKNQLDKQIQLSAGDTEYNLVSEQEVEIMLKDGDCMYIDPLNHGNVATEISAENMWSLLANMVDDTVKHYNMKIDEVMGNMELSEFMDYVGSIHKDQKIQLTITKPKKK